MLLPLRDNNPLRHVRFQYVTVALIALSVAVFLYQSTLSDQAGQIFILRFGAIPGVLFGNRGLSPELAVVPAWLTVLTSMFMHGGWLHLGGNMLFLWVVGDNVEDALGHVRFVVFYILCGIAAALLHAITDTASVVPMVGASGAISGVIGAYLVLHPHASIQTLVIRFIVSLPAYVVLGLWAGLQAISAVGSLGQPGGVAWWAHVGGLIAGAILVIPMRRAGVPLFGGASVRARPRTGPQAPPQPRPQSHARRKRRSMVPDTRRRD